MNCYVFTVVLIAMYCVETVMLKEGDRGKDQILGDQGGILATAGNSLWPIWQTLAGPRQDNTRSTDYQDL